MNAKRFLTMILTILFLVSALGCGQDLPFQYRYLSANTVQIEYQGRLYQLERYGEKADTPFDYEFEDDGDLDIMVDGRRYDIDSPYDLDKPKKKLKKKAKKKTKKKSKKKRR